MTKEPKTLPEAIKIIVGIYGKDVVKDVRMVNIMNDVVSIEEQNAVKTILKECIRLGYGGKILSLSTKDDYHLKIKTYSKDISNSRGYKIIIVQYVLYSLAYGIGICQEEPYIKIHAKPQTEKDRNLKPKNSQLTKTVEKKQLPYIKMSVAFAVLFICTIVGFSLWNASEEREKFQNRVFNGDSFLNSGDYDNAVESYKEAYNGYNALNSGSYKEEALSRIGEVTEMLLKEGKTDNKSLRQAYQILQSEMQLNLEKEDKERLQEKIEEVETIITEKTDNGRNTLITDISANNGVLDENGKKLLKELLELSPNDYWLNFIKNKSYE